MTKKRTKRVQRKTRSRQKRRFVKNSQPDTRLHRTILAKLYESGVPLGINDLLAALQLSRTARSSIETSLETLILRQEIQKTGKKTFALNRNLLFDEATLEKNPRGFGFATNLSSEAIRKKLKKDPFISASRMASARHGDQVLIKITRIRRDGRPEAEVIDILKRGKNRLAGIYRSNHHHNIVVPDDPRYPFSVIVPQQPPPGLTDGDAVIVKILNQPGTADSPCGEIVKVLGNPASALVQKELVVEKFDLTNDFSFEAEQESLSIEPTPGIEQREDLRDLLHITIDGEDAKDFDDAVCVEKKRNGFRLWVSIADVGAYVTTGSRLDQEAYERGTSVYFPGSVIPMLPENLSNNLCSLLPGKDRLTVTVQLDFDRSATLKKKTFFRSVITSKQRFTYDVVKKIIIDRDPKTRSAHKRFLTPLKWAAELATGLQTKRHTRGSVRFTIPEAKISLNPDETIKTITRTESHFAHQMIEEFMLAANEAVADTFNEADRTTLFRIHETPDADKVSEFIQFAATLGITLPPSGEKHFWCNTIIRQASGTPHEYIINNLLLRTMQQARYSINNLGHFGLAAENYLHFTSPIRRYPDLVVHRQLCTIIENPQAHGRRRKIRYAPTALKEAGLFLSARERAAISAERDMVDRLKAQFMSSRIGDIFEAVVSGVSESSLYVELIDIFISGSIKLSTMSDDYYLLDEKRYRVVGDISGTTFQVGDELRVELIEVDSQRNKINFRRFTQEADN